MKNEYELKVTDVNCQIKNLNESLMAVDLDIIKSYCERNTFAKLKGAVNQMKISNYWTCYTCFKKVNEKFKTCGSCLRRFHLNCGTPTKELKTGIEWTCRECDSQKHAI